MRNLEHNKHCPSCGKELPESAPFCGYCGFDFSKACSLEDEEKKTHEDFIKDGTVTETSIVDCGLNDSFNDENHAQWDTAQVVVDEENERIELLKKYKEIFDEEVINGEEFATKKSQLLNLDSSSRNKSMQGQNTADELTKIELLKEYKKLFDAEILNNTEFEKKKAQILYADVIREKEIERSKNEDETSASDTSGTEIENDYTEVEVAPPIAVICEDLEEQHNRTAESSISIENAELMAGDAASIKDEVKCPKCGATNKNTMRFCRKCGEQLIEKEKTEPLNNDNKPEETVEMEGNHPKYIICPGCGRKQLWENEKCVLCYTPLHIDTNDKTDVIETKASSDSCKSDDKQCDLKYKKCKNCGAEIEVDMWFCTQCGNPVN